MTRTAPTFGAVPSKDTNTHRMVLSYHRFQLVALKTRKQHDWLGEEVSGKANNNSRHVDPRTGRRCSNNEAMGVEERTESDDDEEKDTYH